MKQVHTHTIGGGGWKLLQRKGDDIRITKRVGSHNRDSVDVFNLGRRLYRRPTGKIPLQDRKLILTRLRLLRPLPSILEGF